MNPEYEKDGRNLGSRPGYNQVDMALDKAGWAVDWDLGFVMGFPLYPWEGEVAETKAKFGSKEAASKAIKSC